MNILVTGASGMIGTALASFLVDRGHHVTCLVRGKPAIGAREIHWNPDAGEIDAASLTGIDGVVHLAGENLGAGRWTAARKKRILESRVAGTRLLAGALSEMQRPPKVMVSASAIGYYGDRGAELLREESGPGSGFLADVCRRWEEAAIPVQQKGVRLVVTRTGMVLSSRGGALARMLTPFRLGAGGRIGSGRQYMSWITMKDLLEIFHFALVQPSLAGAINAVAPDPVTNLQFVRTLGRVLRRPALFPLPAAAIRMLFGEMGEQMLLTSLRVEPARLAAAGFRFQHPELEGALRQVLAGTDPVS